jgi:hypothetical protein
MSKNSRFWDWVATAAGSAALVTSMSLIGAEGVRSGFTADLIVGQVVLLLATVASIMLHARPGGWAKVGMASVAVFGAIIVLVLNTGRFAADRDAKALNAGELAKDKAGVTADIRKYESELLSARTEAKTICAKYPNGKSCRGATAKVGGLVEHIDFLKEDRSDIKLVAADSEGERVSTVLSWFGLDKSVVQARYDIVRPMMSPLFLEFAAALFLIIGIGGLLRHDVVEAAPKAVPEPDKGEEKPAPAKVVSFPRPRVLHSAEFDVGAEALFAAVGSGCSNDELAARLKVSKATASRRVSMAVKAGTLNRERVGREVAITLVN